MRKSFTAGLFSLSAYKYTTTSSLVVTTSIKTTESQEIRSSGEISLRLIDDYQSVT